MQGSEKTVGSYKTELADKSLIGFVKIIAELRRSQEILQYSKHQRIIGSVGQNYQVKLGLALHIGQSVEGTIGSENYKVDAHYLSLHLEVVTKLVEEASFYEVNLLMSENFYGILSLKAKNCCRKIDVVSIFPYQNPFGVYTFDMSYDDDPVQPPDPEKHQIGALIKQQQLESVNVDTFQNKGVDYMFTLDADLVSLNKFYQSNNAFQSNFRNALGAYIQGEWFPSCLEILDQILEQYPKDGPTNALKNIIVDRKKAENVPFIRDV